MSKVEKYTILCAEGPMKKPKLSRRTFLETAAAATIAAQMKFAGAQGAARTHEDAWPENGTLIPDEGWRLWVDEKAEWKQDAIFLPEDVTQGSDGVVRGKGEPLPVNAPTGGWGVLSDAAGIGVTLPSTVEQHYWGKFGAGDDGKPRAYTPDEYRYAADDPVPQNGAYFGVSWWWREIEIPAAMQGKRIFLHIRGARLRAEVYLNRKLVGYSILEELPFEAELTNAANPGGKNVLAIRITNPFGRFDWVDGLNAQWGAVKLYRSHGFGGLDRGMTISAHGKSRIKDAWVLNDNIRPRTIYFEALVESPHWADCTVEDDRSCLSSLKVDVIDPRTGKVMPTEMDHPGVQGKDGVFNFHMFLICSSVKEWSLDSPNLYHLRLSYKPSDNCEDVRTIAFGFRTVTPEGLGTNALFRLNGRRMKIYTAIWSECRGTERDVGRAPELAVEER